jgi:hypothetical protein
MKNKKTIKGLIVGAFDKKKKPLTLEEIYQEVQRFRPDVKDSTIRGRINESVLRNEKLFKRLGGGVYDIE